AHRHATTPAVEHHSERPAHEAAVEHQAAAIDQRLETGMQRNEPEFCADDAADHGADDDVPGIVRREAVAPALAVHQPAADHEREHHHDAESGDMQRAKPETERICGDHAATPGSVTSPGSG